jgi:DNA modification methylase
MVGDYRRTPQRAYDVILYANKGDRHVQKTSPDVIQIGMLDGAKRHHAAEKPVDLYVDLLSRSVSAGDVVLDPCCGAGPIFPAANRLGCFAIGIEFNPALATIATSRFEEK